MKFMMIVLLTLGCSFSFAKAKRIPASVKDRSLTFLYYIKKDGSVDVFAGRATDRAKSLDMGLESALNACSKKYSKKSCGEMYWSQPEMMKNAIRSLYNAL